MNNLLTNGLEAVPILKTGVLFVKEEPYYIVEWLDDGYSYGTVTVYETNGDKENYGKKLISKIVQPIFSEETLLGSAANKFFGNNKNKRIEEARPLFMSLVEDGIDTFTKEEGLGFKERTKIRPAMIDGKYVTVGGEPTGIFILLSSVRWYKTVVASEDLIKTAYARGLVFDINGKIWKRT